jgi:hypothetical protein
MSPFRTAVIASTLVGLASISFADDLYAIRDGGRLNLLDTATGSRSLIGNSFVPLASSLDAGPDGTLYMHTRPDGVFSPASLYGIDASNAGATFIAELGADFEFEGGMAIRSDGMAYIVGGRDNGSSFECALFLVDLTSGAATEIGILDIGDANGLTLRSDGMLVAWSQFMPGAFTINPDTMKTQILLDGLGDIFNTKTIGGMDSVDGEEAYLLASPFGVGPAASLISLDLYTGEMTLLHEFSSELLITGIASAGSPCLADLTGDGSLNFFDVSAFLVAYSANDPIADFTGDSSLNFFDVSAFLTAFGAGCP